ncbi:MAG: DtxR family transcriptional regulator, Mn-dependent transcriptional regulator [Chloroflexota bacterium]|nr:DtxR family transcriptional regulator, Mn-dependent transcriptional regulator [Chloroflexota bacterium]
MSPTPAAEPAHSQTIGRYLEAIYYIDAEGDAVRASRLAEWLSVSQPTASATLQRMVRDRLVKISPAKVITFTARGRAEAEGIVRRHRIAERWLTDVLGLDWVQADEEAGKLEHAFSDEVADRLHELIGRPVTCPHGNPIPGTRPAPQRQRKLSSLEPGERSRVRRVSEVAEHEAPELLGFLAQSGLVLGAEVEAVARSVGAGTQTVRAGGREVAMSLDVADKIWVGR